MGDNPGNQERKKERKRYAIPTSDSTSRIAVLWLITHRRARLSRRSVIIYAMELESHGIYSHAWVIVSDCEVRQSSLVALHLTKALHTILLLSQDCNVNAPDSDTHHSTTPINAMANKYGDHSHDTNL